MRIGLFALFVLPLAAQTPSAADRELARGLLKELIEINTTDSSGDNTRAAEAMAARFRSAGFAAEDVQVLTPSPRKGNLVVRYRGKAGAGTKPILFLGHLDVVEARRSDWSMDPFQLNVQDGYFYGRGTQDMKSDDALMVATFLILKREGFQPPRDLILALTSDEEGGEHNGVEWLVNNRRELIDAAFCVNADSGGGHIRNGKRIIYAVEGAEKIFMSFRLIATNRGGHSSQPRKDNAIYDVTGALNRLQAYEFPVHLNTVTQAYFERMSSIETGRLAADFRGVAQSPVSQTAVAHLSEDPYYNALLRTTCVPTELNAGHVENALPQKAEAIVNCRVLPNETEAGTLAKLKELAGQQVTVEPVRPPRPAPAVKLDPHVLSAMQRVIDSLDPGLRLIPVMDTGASDGIILEAAGMPVYGISALFYDDDDIRAHGRDERVRTEWFDEGLTFELRLVRMLSTS